MQFKPWCHKNRFFLLFKVFLCQDQKNLVIGEILLSLGIMSLHRVVRKKQWFPFSVFLRYAFHWIGNETSKGSIRNNNDRIKAVLLVPLIAMYRLQLVGIEKRRGR